jgi:hypothetical protein
VQILFALEIQLEQRIIVGLGLVKENLIDWTSMYSVDHIWSYRWNFIAIQVGLKTIHLKLSSELVWVEPIFPSWNDDMTAY